MSWVFNCVFGAAAVCLLPYWLWKLPQGRRYRAGILHRLGFVPHMPATPRLWLHCASVGEAAIPRRLVAEIRRRRPGWEIVFSTNTDTGAQRLEELYPESRVFYMPLDFSFCVGRALERIRPSVVLLVELEVWPNFLDACRARQVPAAIVSGRIGKGSRRLLRVINRCLTFHDYVKFCGLCPVVLDEGLHSPQLVVGGWSDTHFAIRAHHVGQQAIVPQGTPHRLHTWPGSNHPDGDARLLDRRGWGVEAGLFDLVMLPLVVEGLPAPQTGQDLQAFIQQLGSSGPVGHFPEGRKAGVDGPQADRQNHPPVGQVVERGRLAGEFPRPHPGQRGDHGAQANALGAHGSCSKRDPCVNAPYRLPDEEAIPASGFSLVGKLGGSASIAFGKNETVFHLPFQRRDDLIGEQPQRLRRV